MAKRVLAGEGSNKDRPTFAYAILNALTSHIAVLDENGTIVAVNDAWERFAQENGGNDPAFYVGVNYLTVCEAALQQGSDEIIEAVLDGIRAVLQGEQAQFSLEYPCHAPTQERWFIVRVTRLSWQGSRGVVVAHEEITARKQVEAQLAYDAALLANVNDVIIGTDQDFTITFWNRAAEKIFGWSAQEVLGRPVAALLQTEFSDTNRAESIRALAETGNWVGEVTQRARDGRPLIFEANILTVYKPDGRVAGYVSANRDITQRKQAELALQESESRFRHLTESLPDAVYTLDLVSERTTYFNHETFLGYSREELMSPGLLLRELHPDDTPALMAHWHRALADEETGGFVYRLRNKAGQWEWVESRETIVSRNADGTAKELMVILTVITARKQAEEEVRVAHEAIEVANRDLRQALAREQIMARVDELTQVSNRRYFFDLATHEFAVAQRYGYPLSILLFDLDHFKQINDTYGHQAGDEVLQQVAQRVCSYLRETDVLARYGGEEFIIMLPATTARRTKAVAERIRRGMAAHGIETHKGEVRVTTSIGIAESLPPPDSLDGLIRRADQALYAAKAAGRNRTVCFTPSMHEPT